MAGFEDIQSVMKRDHFVAAADELLGRQDDPQASFEHIIEGAQLVAEQLGNVASGKLEVEPPLSDEQVEQYTTTSQRIISLGQKARESVEKAAALRQASTSGSSKRGAGGEGKG